MQTEFVMNRSKAFVHTGKHNRLNYSGEFIRVDLELKYDAEIN